MNLLDRPAVGLGFANAVTQDRGDVYWLAGVPCDVLAESFHAAGSGRSFTDSPDAERLTQNAV